MNSDITHTIEILAHVGSNHLAAAEALAETNRQLWEMERAERIAQAWTPIVEALKQAVPAALHQYITAPADLEPKEEDSTSFYGITFQVNPITLALPGCMAIYAYWHEATSTFRYRAGVWLEVVDDDGIITLEPGKYSELDEGMIGAFEPSLEITVFRAKKEYEAKDARQALVDGQNRLRASLRAEAEDAAQRRADNSAAKLLERAVFQTTVDPEKAKLLVLRAIGLTLVDLVEVTKNGAA